MKMSPEASAEMERGRLLAGEGRLDEAVEVLEAAVDLAPDVLKREAVSLDNLREGRTCSGRDRALVVDRIRPRDGGEIGPTILVVNDLEHSREWLQTLFFQFFGATVLVVEDTDSAMACLEERIPDLVTTDLYRERYDDGLDLLHRIRSDHRFAHIPVVAITASPGLAACGRDPYRFDHVIPALTLPPEMMARVEQVLAGSLRRPA